METISNKEKAKEIATRWKAKGLPYNAIYDTALEAMQWKDEQHKQEKQQWIDKACKEFCNCCAYAYMACRRYNYDNLHCRHYIKFKKAMKGE